MLHKHEQKQLHNRHGDKLMCYLLSVGESINRQRRTSLFRDMTCKFGTGEKQGISKTWTLPLNNQ